MKKNNSRIYYAGVGSRETPMDIQVFFTKVAKRFAEQGFILRSGGAIGADMAFEKGCNEAGGEKEIFLPWVGHNDSDSTFIVNNEEALEIAERFHPRWHSLSPKAKLLQARNTHQVLGWDLKTPTDFVICWTKYKDRNPVGGTATAIRIAEAFRIPIFNAGLYGSIGDTEQALNSFMEQVMFEETGA
jgi:hypothetical protein